MDELRRLDTILATMFPGKYRSVGYEFTTDHKGEVHPLYRCYVEGYPYGRGKTYHIAIGDMLKDGEGPKE